MPDREADLRKTTSERVRVAWAVLRGRGSSMIEVERSERYLAMEILERAIDALAEIEAIIAEPLDERAGHGPSRRGQFYRVEGVVRRWRSTTRTPNGA